MTNNIFNSIGDNCSDAYLYNQESRFKQYKYQVLWMKEDEQRSYFFHGEGDNFDHWAINYNHSIYEPSIADILKQMKDNHKEVIAKLQLSNKRVQEMEEKLTSMICWRFNGTSNKKQLQCCIRRQVEKENNQRQPEEENSPIRSQLTKFQNPYSHNQEEEPDSQNSKIIDIYVDQDFEEFSEMLDLQRDRLSDDNDIERAFTSTSALLQHLKSTFAQMGLHFTKCIELYQFPRMKNNNFHSYIDRKDNILFLAQLENNEFVGAFTHLSFNPQPNYIPRENPKSFLCNLTRGLFAFAFRINKTHSYDENYLIFGNWQIKVRWGNSVLQTDWGSNGDCFSLKRFAGNQKLRLSAVEFFGRGAQQKQIIMKRYKIYTFS